MVMFSSTPTPQLDAAAPTVSVEFDATDCPVELASTDVAAYLCIKCTSPCWPDICVHILFAQPHERCMLLEWITMQKSTQRILRPATDRSVASGSKALLARIVTGQLGSLNGAVQLPPSDDDLVCTLLATDDGLYKCEQGSEPCRLPLALTKVSSVAIVDAQSALCIAGPSQELYHVSIIDNGISCSWPKKMIKLKGGKNFLHLSVAPQAGAALGITSDMFYVYHQDPVSGLWKLTRSFAQTAKHISAVTHLSLPSGDVFAIISDRYYLLDAAVTASSRLVPIGPSAATIELSSWIFPMAMVAFGDEILLCDNVRGVFYTRDGKRSRDEALSWRIQPIGFTMLAENQLAVSAWDSIDVITISSGASCQPVKVHSGSNLHLLGDGVWVTSEKSRSRIFVTKPIKTIFTPSRNSSPTKGVGNKRAQTSMFKKGLPPFSLDSPVTFVKDFECL